jgi:aspartyl-tRNA(Asn)/glutamyl-tRNA(Gln) amidotransferase subunit C
VGDLVPMSHPLPLRNVLRDDAVVPCLDRETVLAEAPATEDHRFKVPKILAEEG